MARADPVNVSAGMVDVAFVGTPAGHATVPEGVNDTVPFDPVAVVVCVCVASAEPVNVSAGTVRLGAVAFAAVSDPVPAAIFVAAVFPLVVVAPFVPAGVPALTALDVTELPVNVSAGTVPLEPANVGTPTGHEIVCAGPVTVPFVPAGVPALTADVVALEPLNACAAAVRVATVGVIEFAPPVPPMSPCAASVPSGMAASRAVT